MASSSGPRGAGVSNIVITGANRGIGLELAARYLAAGNRVFATARDPDDADDLRALGDAHGANLQIVRCDVTDDDEVKRLAEVCGSSVAVLINNAGINDSRTDELADMDFAEFAKVFDVNVGGALRVTRALWSALTSSRGKLVFVSSLMGSITDSSGGHCGYRVSKCALNMAMHCVAHEADGTGMTVFAMHPGWVRTRMGGNAAPLGVQEAVASMIATIERAGAAQHATLVDRDGARLPW